MEWTTHGFSPILKVTGVGELTGSVKWVDYVYVNFNGHYADTSKVRFRYNDFEIPVESDLHAELIKYLENMAKWMLEDFMGKPQTGPRPVGFLRSTCKKRKV